MRTSSDCSELGRPAVESTGNMWMRIHDTLEDHGIDTVLANPVKTKMIAQAKIKNDRLDSRILADLLRGDLVYESYVPSKEFREKRPAAGRNGLPEYSRCYLSQC
jgi:transposase